METVLLSNKLEMKPGWPVKAAAKARQGWSARAKAAAGKSGPYRMSRQGPLCRAYFFAEQAQPQPDDFLSSCFAIVPVSAHSGHFFGLHLPSLVAPHFSHLKTAISSSFFESVIFGGAAVPELSQGKPRAGACVVSLKLKIRTSKIIIMQNNFASYLLGPKRPGSPGIVFLS